MNLVMNQKKVNTETRLPALVKKVISVCESDIPDGDAWSTIDVTSHLGYVTPSPAGLKHPVLMPYRIKITYEGRQIVWWANKKTVKAEKARRIKEGLHFEN